MTKWRLSIATKVLTVLLLLCACPGKAVSVGTHAKYSFLGAFDTTGLIILGVGVAGTAVAFSNDIQAHDSWVNYQRMSSDTARVGDFWGTGIPEAAVALGQLLLDSENGWVTTEGLLTSTAVTYGLKYSTRRQRLDSDTRTSFPSGHTQVSFALASSLTVEYGWWVGIPFIGMGVFTGLSRLADNAHWLSDVVAGATLGALFGRASYDHHFVVVPYSYDDGRDHELGLSARWAID
jgi:membrane-associated phospholipid phosphatase